MFGTMLRLSKLLGRAAGERFRGGDEPARRSAGARLAALVLAGGLAKKKLGPRPGSSPGQALRGGDEPAYGARCALAALAVAGGLEQKKRLGPRFRGGDEPAFRARCALAALAVAGGLVGCATIPADSGKNPVDPWESYNRQMFDINDRVDRAVLKPVAQAYVEVVPQPVRDCVGNAFSNLNDVPNALNNLLQGKPGRAVSDICRVAINSTVGLLGCFDVASKMGLEKSDEDFGQTLGRWGVGQGPYFVWPLLGPSTVRDSVGRVAGFYTDPLDRVDHVRTRNVITGTRIIDLRASLLPAERVIEGAALDRYQFIRDAYLQRRRNLVYDGNPPREKDPEDEGPEPKADESSDKPAVTPGNEKPAAGGDQPSPPPGR